jgi:hypothetical protein
MIEAGWVCRPDRGRHGYQVPFTKVATQAEPIQEFSQQSVLVAALTKLECFAIESNDIKQQAMERKAKQVSSLRE